MQQSVQLARYSEYYGKRHANALFNTSRFVSVERSAARAIPLEGPSDRRAGESEHASDRSLKWHSQARIASLETPNHVAEYIIRLLSTVQLRARTCNQCRSSLVNARETSPLLMHRIPSIIQPDRETPCHEMDPLAKGKSYNSVVSGANL